MFNYLINLEVFNPIIQPMSEKIPESTIIHSSDASFSFSQNISDLNYTIPILHGYSIEGKGSVAVHSRHTVKLWVLETSLWKLSAGFGPSFLADIRNWLAGLEGLSF